MKAIIFFALLAGIYAQVSSELGACGICTMVVNTLEESIGRAVTKEALMKELATLSVRVCDNVPSKIATKEQCTSFVSLYGPYTIDMLLSDAKPESICRTIGMCDAPTDTPQYRLIFPTINSEHISYSVTEDNVLANTAYNYKIFLANPSFLEKNGYELSVNVNQIVGCDVSLKITNKTDFVETDTCTKEKNCNMNISKPGRGVWYYITISTKMHAAKAAFSFTAIERNQTKSGHWVFKADHRQIIVGRFAIILCLTFSTLCLLCTCFSRCVFRRRGMILKKCRQQQTEPVFVGFAPETVVSIQEPVVTFPEDEPQMVMMYPQNVPMVFPYVTHPSYIQMQQLPNGDNL